MTLKTYEEWMDEIISFYCKNFSKQKKEMEDCKHYYNDNPNVYHMEDSVWTHTMMVCTARKMLFIQDNGEGKIPLYQCLDFILISLLHDYGKVLTRKEDHDKLKTHFRGHAYMSVNHTIEVYYKLMKKYNTPEYVDDYSMEYLLTKILYVISRHMDYDKVKTEEELIKFSNDRLAYMNEMYKFSISDFRGRVTDNSREWAGRDNYIKLYKTTYENFNEIESNINSKCDFTIYCGLPGSGKDYNAEKDGKEHILSFDNIRINNYKSFCPSYNSSKTDAEIYKEAYEYTNSVNLDLIKSLENILKTLKSKGIDKNIAICNTNLTIDARRKLISCIRRVFPNASIGCNIILAPVDFCIKNDSKRTCKNLGPKVIESFRNIVFPTMLEGFNFIDTIIPEITE